MIKQEFKKAKMNWLVNEREVNIKDEIRKAFKRLKQPTIKRFI